MDNPMIKILDDYELTAIIGLLADALREKGPLLFGVAADLEAFRDRWADGIRPLES